MAKYVWCEDKGAGFDFWQLVFSSIDNEIIVETKKNNSELIKSVAKIKDEESLFYIIVDKAIDNPDVLREMKKLDRTIDSMENVKVLDIHSFEFILLSFKFIEQWVFAEEDELRVKRVDFIDAKNRLVDFVENGGSADVFLGIKESVHYNPLMNTEQVAAKLLFDITRNTGFETNKGNVGQCFIIDCCKWTEREADDICGLDQRRKSSVEKIQCIIEQSVLNISLKNVGLL